jgi:hypothetical protein
MPGIQGNDSCAVYVIPAKYVILANAGIHLNFVTFL